MFHRRFMKWGMAILIGWWWLPLSAQAFTMSPVVADVKIDPGSSRAGMVTITNDEANAQTFYISIQKFIPSGDSGQQQFLSPSDTSGLPNWISFDRPSFMLRPGESRQLPYTIAIPKDATPGGYYAVVFFSNVPPGTAATNVSVGARTGLLFFVTVNGQLNATLRLNDFALETPPQIDRLPASFRVLLQNIGNVHAVPEGTVTVRNMFGSTVARIPLNEMKNRILPNSQRRFVLNWYKELPATGSGFWHDAGEEWRNFAIGPYRATLDVTSPRLETAPSEVLRFTVIPWRLGVLFVLGLCVLSLIGRWHRHWVIARATRG